jgi:hypothetical protein
MAWASLSNPYPPLFCVFLWGERNEEEQMVSILGFLKLRRSSR